MYLVKVIELGLDKEEGFCSLRPVLKALTCDWARVEEAMEAVAIFYTVKIQTLQHKLGGKQRRRGLEIKKT